MSDDIHACQSLLDQVTQVIQCHEEHANKQGENFNIFSILKVGRDEVRTHSRFIYELLNPRGRHGQGNVFLTEFARIVLDCKDYETARNPKREDRTENSVKDRRIDFTLETDSAVIGIELKIDAKDQNRQLYDYYQTLESRAGRSQKPKLFYLTLDGKEASENSYVKGEKKVDYEQICFSENILNWISKCIQISAEKSVLREALIQYKILVEKLVGINGGLDVKVLKKISKGSEALKAAIEIGKVLNEAKVAVQKKFWSSLLKKLNGKNSVKFDHYFIESHSPKCRKSFDDSVEGYYKYRNKVFGVFCDLGEVDGASGSLHMRLHVEIWDKVYYGLCLSESSDGKRVEGSVNETFVCRSKGKNFSDIFPKEISYDADKKGCLWLTSDGGVRGVEGNDRVDFKDFGENDEEMLVDSKVMGEVIDKAVEDINSLVDEVRRSGVLIKGAKI
ncbi:MAG: PD-(D/E)XK nuclease family protein [Gammaproteobacteria bacterium]|nr:PD-(D/E)XK nuclease family protein [Gammaproteobacteria bacterium]